MKNYIYISFLLLFTLCLQVSAQTTNNKQVPLEIVYFSQLENEVNLTLEVDLRHLALSSNQSLQFSPVISNGEDKSTKLKSILINGTQRDKAFMREVKLKKNKYHLQEDYLAVIKLNRENRKVMRFSTTIPFESWMNDSQLTISTDVCGCGGKREPSRKDLTATLQTKPVEVIEKTMDVAYIRPEVEKVKQRNESQDVFLDFPVARTEINPSFGNNPIELPKIERFIREIHEDKNLRVSGVMITGYASPEGDENFNNQLSRGRAEALRSYLGMRTNIPHNIYRVGYGGEDWQGLAKLVEESYVEQKESVLSIINYTHNVAERKRQLKVLGGGYIYQRLLNDLYPRLRRVCATMEYTVRGFDVDEAKEIFKSHPHQLSLEEMFLVANTYQKQSPEFVDIFETAVRMFPNDPVANNNAAATALASGNLEKARKYLEKADGDTAEYLNNLGIFYWLSGDAERAEKILTEASQKGSTEATNNINKLSN